MSDDLFRINPNAFDDPALAAWRDELIKVGPMRVGLPIKTESETMPKYAYRASSGDCEIGHHVTCDQDKVISHVVSMVRHSRYPDRSDAIEIHNDSTGEHICILAFHKSRVIAIYPNCVTTWANGSELSLKLLDEPVSVDAKFHDNRIGQKCWYYVYDFKARAAGPWLQGFLRMWGTDFIEFESGTGLFPIAVIEDDETGKCCSVPVDQVHFSATKPENETP